MNVIDIVGLKSEVKKGNIAFYVSDGIIYAKNNINEVVKVGAVEKEVYSYTNWDKFKDTQKICKKLGCTDEDVKYCCPELDGSLCIPKEKYLKSLGITEEELHRNFKEVTI